MLDVILYGRKTISRDYYVVSKTKCRISTAKLHAYIRAGDSPEIINSNPIVEKIIRFIETKQKEEEQKD